MWNKAFWGLCPRSQPDLMSPPPVCGCWPFVGISAQTVSFVLGVLGVTFLSTLQGSNFTYIETAQCFTPCRCAVKNCHGTGGQLSPPCPFLSPPLREMLVGAQEGLNSTFQVPVDLLPMLKGIWAVTCRKYPVSCSLLGLAVEGKGTTPGSVEEPWLWINPRKLCTGYCVCKVGGL